MPFGVVMSWKLLWVPLIFFIHSIHVAVFLVGSFIRFVIVILVDVVVGCDFWNEETMAVVIPQSIFDFQFAPSFGVD